MRQTRAVEIGPTTTPTRRRFRVSRGAYTIEVVVKMIDVVRDPGGVLDLVAQHEARCRARRRKVRR